MLHPAVLTCTQSLRLPQQSGHNQICVRHWHCNTVSSWLTHSIQDIFCRSCHRILDPVKLLTMVMLSSPRGRKGKGNTVICQKSLPEVQKVPIPTIIATLWVTGWGTDKHSLSILIRLNSNQTELFQHWMLEHQKRKQSCNISRDNIPSLHHKFPSDATRAPKRCYCTTQWHLKMSTDCWSLIPINLQDFPLLLAIMVELCHQWRPTQTIENHRLSIAGACCEFPPASENFCNWGMLWVSFSHSERSEQFRTGKWKTLWTPDLGNVSARLDGLHVSIYTWIYM